MPGTGARAGRHAARAAGLLVAVAVLVLVCLASVAIGAKALPLSEVWHGLFHYSGTNGDVLVRDVRVPRTVLKLAPGIDHALLPPGAEGEWVSVGGDLVEAAFWCGPLAAVPRRATLLPAGRAAGGAELVGTGHERAPVGEVMTASPKTVRPGQLASEALELINSLKITALIVVESDRPVGIVYFHDLLRAGVA